MTRLRIVTPPSTARQTPIGPPSMEKEAIDGLDPRNLRILDAVFHELALDYAENATATPEEDADVTAIAAFVAELISSRP